MRSYPISLREDVIVACDRSEWTRAQIAERFGVSLTWVYTLLRQRRTTGSIALRPHGGGHPPAFDPQAVVRLRRELEQRPGATVAELRQATGVDCSIAAVYRTLTRLGIPRGRSVR
jgi:transposase